MPRISFDDPIPLGLESQAERMRITLKGDIEGDTAIPGLNAQLPAGLRIVSWRRLHPGSNVSNPQSDTYRIFYRPGHLDEKKLDEFLAADHWSHVKIRSKGESRQLDLKSSVKSIRLIKPQTLELVIHRNGRYAVRPADILAGVFGIESSGMYRFRVLKMAAGRDVNH